MHNFELLISRSFPLVTVLNGDIKVYKHKESEFKVIFAPVDGPLVHSSIYVPTLSENHAGLAHTLEHLIFCGSHEYKRGYLDTLSTRSYSMGTNAYTCEDHTNYSVVTAGEEGALNVLPVFLDHVLRPNLDESHFLTEVCHLNAQGKYNGVVFCEMAARENSESDLLDLAVRQVVFNESFLKNSDEKLMKYAYECGGRTIDIKDLTLNEIREYHKRYYRLDALTLLIVGMVDHEEILSCLDLKRFSSSNHLTSQLSDPVLKDPLELIKRESHLANEIEISETVCSKIVEFPSANEDLGTLGFVWQGPEIRDVKKLLCLDILFQYLQENSASPLQQRLVEGKKMLANFIDFEIKSFLKTCIVLVIGGIPMKADAILDQDEDSESEIEDDESQNLESENYDDKINYDSPGTILASYKSILFDVLKKCISDTNLHASINMTIERYRKKQIETLEEDPLAVISSYLSPDIICDRYQNQDIFGSRLRILEYLSEMESYNQEFWKELIAEELLGSKVGVVMMNPSAKLGPELADRFVMKLDETDGLNQAQILENAVSENKIDLGQDLLSLFPPLPDHGKIVSLSCDSKREHRLLPDLNHGSVDVLTSKCDSDFVSYKLAISLKNIPVELREYLVLLQEILFQSPVVFDDEELVNLEPVLSKIDINWKEKYFNDSVLDYKLVIKLLSNQLTYYDVGVGFGNDVFSCSWLNDYLVLQGQAFCDDNCETSINNLLYWPLKVLKAAAFTQDRIKTVAQTLLRDIEDIKRDGSAMLSNVLTKALFKLSRKPSESDKRDYELSIYTQEGFLKSLFDDGVLDSVSDNLNKLRNVILQELSDNQMKPLFLQLGIPKKSSSTHEQLKAATLTRFSKLTQSQVNRKRKYEIEKPHTGFPLIKPKFILPKRHQDPAIVLPVTGITSCYLIQIVPCDVLPIEGSKHHDDYMPLQILLNMICRNEGPLFSRIRGRGFAYDSGLSVYFWNQQLAFEIIDSREPMRALEEFWQIVEEYTSAPVIIGDNGLVNRMILEASQSQVVYKLKAETSRPAGMMSEYLKSHIHGFENVKDYQAFDEIFSVTDQDLKRVAKTYLSQFLDENKRITVMTSWPNPTESILEARTEKTSIKMTVETEHQ